MNGPDYGEEFAGKRVLITGAAGVIGTWIAEAFSAQDADLLLSDARAEPLDALGERLGTRTAVADLSTADGVAGLIAATDDCWPTADILINNAGVYPRTPLATTTRADVRRVLDINVVAPYQLAQHVIATMTREGVRGCVVNISSGAARRTGSTGGVYAASKAALEMLTRSLALETGEAGIRVVGVGRASRRAARSASCPTSTSRR